MTQRTIQDLTTDEARQLAQEMSLFTGVVAYEATLGYIMRLDLCRGIDGIWYATARWNDSAGNPPQLAPPVGGDGPTLLAAMTALNGKLGSRNCRGGAHENRWLR
jgi:hypothetical protein